MDTNLAQRSEAKDLIGGIKDINYQINLKNSIPLIINLRMN